MGGLGPLLRNTLLSVLVPDVTGLADSAGELAPVVGSSLAAWDGVLDLAPRLTALLVGGWSASVAHDAGLVSEEVLLEFAVFDKFRVLDASCLPVVHLEGVGEAGSAAYAEIDQLALAF